MYNGKKVNKRQIPFIIHDPEPEPVVPGVFRFWNIDGISKSGKRFHDNGKGSGKSTTVYCAAINNRIDL